jgi:hypothetical protein
MAEFHGLPTGRLESQYLSLEYLTEAGPRIVRLHLAGSSENLLADVPDVTLATPLGDYALLGGHRLWHAPEANPRSYIPDDRGVVAEEMPAGATLRGPTEVMTGIQKTIEIRLPPDRPEVRLLHRLTNAGLWPVELAPWGITMLPLGGVAIMPQTVGPLDPSGLLPNRQLVLWPYTSWADPRLHLADDVLLIRAEPALPPCKVGYLNRSGWIGYRRAGVLFVKRFAPRVDLPHPDFGCNAEFYCGDRFIEMESIGPLSRLEPGQSVEHEETWEFHVGLDQPQTLDGIRALASRVTGG